MTTAKARSTKYRGGRKPVPPDQAGPILRRLRGFLTKRFGSPYKATKKLKLNDKTVSGWFSGGRVPDTATILKLGVLTGMSADYLLWGDGDPLRLARAAPKELGSSLRQKLSAELLANGMSAREVDAFLPPGSGPLNEVVEEYVRRGQEWAEAKRVRFRGLTVEQVKVKLVENERERRMLRRYDRLLRASPMGPA